MGILSLESGKEEKVSIKEETKVLTPRQSLESKIESILRSIENLSAKKLRIEAEIRRQKKSLANKRQELKVLSSKVKVSIKAESSTLDPNSQEITKDENKRIQLLLRESAKVLEN